MRAAHDMQIPVPENSRHAKVREWWPVWVGVLALYVPTIVRLANDIWPVEDHWHEPMMLVVCLYLLWQKRAFWRQVPGTFFPNGWWLIVPGLGMYVVGRALNVISLEVLSTIPVLAGLVWLMCGVWTLRRLLVPLAFFAFVVPLPFFVVDFLSSGLKVWVSEVVVNVLYHLGFPAAREGVVIQIGQYQLLVADACSGMRSLYSLTAMGLLYAYVRNPPDNLSRFALMLSALPIAIVTNIFRVIALVLITYYYGDAAGRGAHDMLGIAIFIVALAMLLGVEQLCDGIRRRRK